MPIALEWTLILVLVALALAVVPLLLQLRKTAQGLDQFLLSARRDLSQISEDVHASRIRVDHLAATLQITLNDLSTFTNSIREVGITVKEWHHRFRSTVESVSLGLGGVLGGLSSLLAFFKHKPPHQDPRKDPHHERS
jgi:uncharacterized protein YoxC